MPAALVRLRGERRGSSTLFLSLQAGLFLAMSVKETNQPSNEKE